MNAPFFKRTGIFYIPTSVIGWILVAFAVALSVFLFITIDSKSHSASDTLINFGFYLLIIGAGYSFIAYLINMRTR